MLISERIKMQVGDDSRSILFGFPSIDFHEFFCQENWLSSLQTLFHISYSFFFIGVDLYWALWLRLDGTVDGIE